MDTEAGARQRSRAPHPRYDIRLARLEEPDLAQQAKTDIAQQDKADIDLVLELIDHAADWLRDKKNTTQWARPWPSPYGRWKRVHDAIRDEETWLLFHGTRPIGTVSIKLEGHEELWTPEERETEAVYLHRLVIHRDYAGGGLGTELIDWAGRKGASLQPDAELVRIDVWTDNGELHDYYRRQGFKDVAVRTTSDKTPSGALFEKPLEPSAPAAHPHIVESQLARVPRHPIGPLVIPGPKNSLPHPAGSRS
ncbi:GNAT family N-acetyltransferase [Actinomadura sp. 1N219]|uniref:GNAT family N-acetyltransferase n=1 Tax=Actinomadura sp. 1N219 TaxID=3375152 RepID=UPI0037B4364C